MVKHKHKRPTRADKVAETKRLKAAGAVFLEFHESTSWAHDKLRSGTVSLTAEDVTYMQGVLAHRRDLKAHEAELAAQNEAADLAAKVQANKEAEL